MNFSPTFIAACSFAILGIALLVAWLLRAMHRLRQQVEGVETRLNAMREPDAQAEKEREQLLLHAATTDSLTGLLNRQATELKIERLLSNQRVQPEHHALLMIDIDRFKQVNDLLGHAGGDEILRMVARLLRSRFREEDVIGRFGGDEFLVLMKGCASPESLSEKVRELLDAAAKVSKEISVSFSVGIALFPEHADCYHDLFCVADAALYHVKECGRNNWYLIPNSCEAKEAIENELLMLEKLRSYEENDV